MVVEIDGEYCFFDDDVVVVGEDVDMVDGFYCIGLMFYCDFMC